MIFVDLTNRWKSFRFSLNQETMVIVSILEKKIHSSLSSKSMFAAR